MSAVKRLIIRWFKNHLAYLKHTALFASRCAVMLQTSASFGGTSTAIPISQARLQKDERVIFKALATSTALLSMVFLLAGCGHGLINRLI
ncbi:hypothetical protein NKG60_18020 [Mesorhizobium sp. M1428]|uniref:hypothetical protein n=1 Tax=unclassified Mesorhizobium TaxID=325217 RepID=UPI00333E10EC